jgi:hypothetical protein
MIMKKMNARIAAAMVGAALSTAAMAQIPAYSQTFESLNAVSGSALANDNWKVFGNVFSPGGGYLYGYGTFSAPNGTPGFCSIASGEAGPNQGNQYINVYSDYNNGDHAVGNLIEANVFQERTLVAADLGKTYNFKFDYKAAFIAGPAGATKTFAFIKVLNPFTGYTLVANPNKETTLASKTEWSEGNTLSITIDNSWTGHLLQFGFVSTATNYQNSGVFYDNISFGPAATSNTISGKINPDGWTDTLAMGSMTFEIRNNGNVVDTKVVSVDADGDYSFTTTASGVNDVWVNGGRFLSKLTSGVTISSSTTLNVNLANGDATNDESCDLLDYFALSDSYNLAPGDAGYNAAADFNGDDSVDLLDYFVLSDNYNAAGDE